MHQLATSPAADPSLNVAMEGSSDVAFDAGTAAFEINYPFVWQSAQKANPSVAKQMGYALFPTVVPGIAPHVSIGGYNLGVSAHSKHPQLAFDAIQCLTQEQNEITLRGQGRPRAGQSEHLQHPVVRQGLSVPRADRSSSSRPTGSARRRRPTPTSRSRSRRRSRPPRTSTRTAVVSTLRNEIKLSLSSGALL